MSSIKFKQLSLKILKTKEADIVITDISMPGMDGIELSRQLKSYYPNIKVIVFGGKKERLKSENLKIEKNVFFYEEIDIKSDLMNIYLQLLKQTLRMFRMLLDLFQHLLGRLLQLYLCCRILRMLQK